MTAKNKTEKHQTVYENWQETEKPEAYYISGDYKGKDLISVDQITSREDVDQVLEGSLEMERKCQAREETNHLKGYRVALLFYQESSRTFSSHFAAAKLMGAHVIPMHGMATYSSAVKGEDLHDTIKTFERTTLADIIVLRHPLDESSIIASKAARVPIINAGSGRAEHPTQALLDMDTISRELGRTDDLVVTMTGDLRNGRTIKSLAKLLALTGNNININFISPEILRAPPELVSELNSKGVRVLEGENGDLDDAIKVSDVLYVTRIQGEWFTLQAKQEIVKHFGLQADEMDPNIIQDFAAELGRGQYEKAVEGYVINREKMQLAKKKMILMHPLPRVNEISKDVDNDPRAVYFKQIEYGLYTRMALMAKILGKM